MPMLDMKHTKYKAILSSKSCQWFEKSGLSLNWKELLTLYFYILFSYFSSKQRLVYPTSIRIYVCLCAIFKTISFIFSIVLLSYLISPISFQYCLYIDLFLPLSRQLGRRSMETALGLQWSLDKDYKWDIFQAYSAIHTHYIMNGFFCSYL
jgi:hypothetical protein